MISLILTVLFYLAAGLLVSIICPKSIRMLAWGSLPITWVSILAILGLLETLCYLPSSVVLVLLTAGFVVWLPWKYRKEFSNFSLEKPSVQAIVVCIFIAAAFFLAYQVHTTVPWGSWDPMFTWIMRARFLVDGGSQWTNGFSNDLALLHPDYPPMFSWALVPLWGLDGSQSSLAVASLFYPFLLSWVLILLGWWNVSHKNQPSMLFGAVAIAVILSTPLFLYLFAIKSLDLVLSFAIFASLAWYQCSKIERSRFTDTTSYFVVAWAALVKNEGQLWVVSFFAALVLLRIVKSLSDSGKEVDVSSGHQTNWKFVFQGALVPIAFLVLFKISIAPPNDLMHPERAFQISQVIQPEVFLNPYSLLVRLDQVENLEWHKVIWNHFGNVALNWKSFGFLLWATPVFLAWSVFRNRKRFPAISLAIAIQLIGYYVVYLLTPYNPYWHVTTSMDRLLIHVAPAAVALFGFSLCLARNETDAVESKMGKNNRVWIQIVLLCVPVVSVVYCYSQVQAKSFPWNFQNETIVQKNPFREIDFPLDVSHATFVTEKFEPATLYRMQFSMVPTILVVDRREEYLLGSFSSDEKLKQYCTANRWELKNHKNGLGWAVSKDSNGPLPHMDRIREQFEQSN